MPELSSQDATPPHGKFIGAIKSILVSLVLCVSRSQYTIYLCHVMKNHNIGALDLKSSNGRVLYKRSKRASALSAKSMGKLVAEFMKSEEKAAELLNFLNEHKEVKQTEKLAYENFD